jgi:DNA-binding response OmpR family regulator
MVEDDAYLVEVVTEYLEKNHFEVTSVARGDEVFRSLAIAQPDLILLDLMLPGLDGVEVCKLARARGIEVPILMLTAKDEDFDRVLGLECGADDYLVKPLQPRVLLAHMRAVLRRRESPGALVNRHVLTFGSLVIHSLNREVILNGARIEMTAAEFDLLWLLASNAGRVMTRNELLNGLRGIDYTDSDRSVDARLYRLRKRFGTSEITRYIKSVRPRGYMFSLEPWQ